MCSNLSKTLLRNVIRHTDTHNRIVEEKEMWQARDGRRERTSRKRKHRDRSPARRESKSSSSKVHSTVHQVAYSRNDMPRAHMDRSSPTTTVSTLLDDWKELDKEEKDTGKWGHAGFKELYPEQFLTDSDSSGSDSGRSRRKKSKKDLKKKKKKSKDKYIEKKHKHKSKRKSSRSDRPEYQWVAKSADSSPSKKHIHH